MDAWVGHQVGLELSDVHVERTIKAQGGCEGRDDLRQETIQVGVGRTLNVQIAAADVVQGLVVVHDGNISVLQKRVNAKHCVVWLDDRSSHLRAGPHGEAQFGLLAVINGKALQHEAAETTAGATTDGVVNHETLQACAVVGELADAVQDQIDNLLANGVVATSEVVGGILFACDQLFWVEELTVCASTHLVNNCWLEVNHDAARDVLASTSLREEGVEGVISATNGLVAGHLAIWLNAVLQAEELPAGITNLHTTLTKVKAKYFTHDCKDEEESLG